MRAVLLARRAQLGVVETGAGKVALFACHGVLAVLQLRADRVEDEDGVDDPDAGGEVGAAFVDVGVAAGAGAFAQGAVDAQLARRRPGAGGERVELAVELVGGAVEDAGELAPVGAGQLGAGARDLLDGVEQCAVVDAHGVGVFVLDQSAVHEGAEVAQRAVVQLRAGDAGRDRGGEAGCDLVHVGEAVGERGRQLVPGGAFGHPGADGFGQRQLAAQVVRLLGRDAWVGADGRDPVRFGKSGARLPAVAELGLLIDELEFLAAVGLSLDAQDLLAARIVVEQEHDQATHRC